jgi:hypothetical protein
MGMMPRLLGPSVLATVLAGAFTLLNAPTALALDNDATSFKLEAGAYFPKVQNLPLPKGLLLQLQPTANGWDVAVIEADHVGFRNPINLADITPPLHGPNPTKITAQDLSLSAQGANKFPLYGTRREILFAQSVADRQLVRDKYECLHSWNKRNCALLPDGEGGKLILTITDYKLTPALQLSNGRMVPETLAEIIFTVDGNFTGTLAVK